LLAGEIKRSSAKSFRKEKLIFEGVNCRRRERERERERERQREITLSIIPILSMTLGTNH
jgi:hypothetical protein